MSQNISCYAGRSDIHDHGQMYHDFQEFTGEPWILREIRKFNRGGRGEILLTMLSFCVVAIWWWGQPDWMLIPALSFIKCIAINKLIDFLETLLRFHLVNWK